MILRLIVQHLGLAVATLVGVSAVVFAFTSVLPGDIAARVLGRESTAEQRALFRDRLHLDRPVVERSGIWLGNVVQGDLGRSLVNDQEGQGDVVLPKAAGHALPLPRSRSCSTCR